jgi:type I restriction enzyme S subunit
MKPEAFFEKFELLADAPGAMGKMRELVLEFAVQGRLVPQNSKDESAQALLKRVVSSAKTRRQMADELDKIDAPFPIPETWAWVRLPRVLKKLTDGTHHSPPNGPSGEFMYVTAKNIKTDGVLLDGISYVNRKVHDEIYSRCDPSFGDILYIKDGATTGIATINQVKKPFSMLSSVALLKPSDVIFNRYLLWAMRSPFFYSETRGAMKGAAITRVTLSVMAASLLPLPPLAEQKRIVAKVDELMALCDRLEAQQQERETRHAALARASLARFADAPTPANLNFIFHPSYSISPADLRKSIHTLAVQGDLSAGSSDPTEWSAVKMKDVCDLITDGEHATPQRVPSGVPLATAKNVRDGFLDMTQTDFVASETAEKCWKRCKPHHADILMVCVGATTGRVCLVTNPPDMVLVRSVALLRPNIKRIEATFLDLFLRSPSGQSQIWGGVRQNAQPCLYLGKMSEFTIQLPPLSEQRRIVAKVEQLMALVDTLETQLAASRTTAANLLSALVAELAGPPEGRVVSTAPVKPIVASARPNPQKTTVATAKPAAQEFTVSPRTLADLRKAAGLTQATVAEAMGLNQAYISQLETGKRPITEELRQKLLKIFAKKKNQHHVLQSAAT